MHRRLADPRPAAEARLRHLKNLNRDLPGFVSKVELRSPSAALVQAVEGTM